MYELHLCIRADVLNRLRQERGLVSLLTHLLLDELVRLVNTLPQSVGHATTGVLESGAGTPIREISHLFLLDVLCGGLLVNSYRKARYPQSTCQAL